MTAELSSQAVPLERDQGLVLAEILPSRASLSTFLFALCAIAALLFGWGIRGEYFLTAESGLGYALGIVGGSMMLGLLMYPLRKRFYNSSVFIFSTKNWFKLHMILGVLGPLLILYHCNFGLGSTNSNIALGSMLLMVASGLVGRFIYGKIHFGLYGKKMELRELLNCDVSVKAQLEGPNADTILISEPVRNRMHRYEKNILAHRGVLGTFLNVATLGLTTRLGYFEVIRKIKLEQWSNPRYKQLSRKERKQYLAATKQHVYVSLSTVRKIAGLKFYERLFSLWHMLHLPIFFMLIVTGFVHVYAVHAY
ncbi:MAG: hypothetical protein AB8B81_22900 [Halioglobus sp.]